MNPKVSIILSTCNDGELLEKTVTSIIEKTDYDNFEIIIVANGVLDNSLFFLENSNFNINVRLLEFVKPLGVSNARNKGGIAARGEYLLFLDAHMLIDNSNYISKFISDSRKYDNNCILGSEITLFPGNTKQYGSTWSFDINDSYNHKFVDKLSDDSFECFALTGGVIFLPNDVFKKLDGFDTGIKQWGGETFELCIRGWLFGIKTIINPNINFLHKTKLSSEDFKYPRNWSSILFNNLRIALMYFNKQRLQDTIDYSKQFPESANAFIEILNDSSHLRRIETFNIHRIYDDEWLFNKFKYLYNNPAELKWIHSVSQNEVNTSEIYNIELSNSNPSEDDLNNLFKELYKLKQQGLNKINLNGEKLLSITNWSNILSEIDKLGIIISLTFKNLISNSIFQELPNFKIFQIVYIIESLNIDSNIIKMSKIFEHMSINLVIQIKLTNYLYENRKKLISFLSSLKIERIILDDDNISIKNYDKETIKLHFLSSINQTKNDYLIDKLNEIESLDSNQVGFYFQVYKSPKASLEVLKSVRKYYPDAPILVVSDNGYDYSDLCNDFNCKYIHSKYNLTMEHWDYVPIDGLQKADIWFSRLLEAVKYCKSKWLVLLEDDVICTNKIKNFPETDAAGVSGEWNVPFTQEFRNYAFELTNIKAPQYFGWCGGSIINTSSFINAIQSNSFNMDICHSLDKRIGEHSDVTMNALLAVNGMSYSTWSDVLESNNLDLSEKYSFIHSYKGFYKKDFTKEDRLSYNLSKFSTFSSSYEEGYFFIAIGEKFINEIFYLLDSKELLNDSRPCTILTEEKYFKKFENSKFKNLNLISYTHQIFTKYTTKDLTDFEKYGTIPKINIFSLTPYKKTIFLDSDTLFIKNPDILWNFFKSSNIPLGIAGENNEDGSSPETWHWDNIREIEKVVGKTCPQINSGVVYYNKSLLRSSEIQDYADHIFNKYKDYNIKPYFRDWSIPDEIILSIILSKYDIKPFNIFNDPIQIINDLPDLTQPSHVVFHNFDRDIIKTNKVLNFLKNKSNEVKDILVLVAHRDDETLWCGGTILNNPQHNWKVITVTGRNDDIRDLEFYNVCKTLGVDYEIWDFPEGMEVEVDKVKLLNKLNKLNFDVIITHNSEGEYGHIQHKQIHEVVSQLNCLKVYFGWGVNDSIDITTLKIDIDKKKQLYGIYQSQEITISELIKWIGDEEKFISDHDISFLRDTKTNTSKKKMQN